LEGPKEILEMKQDVVTDQQREQREWTNVIINQFYTGIEEDYPFCCILFFISGSLYESIKDTYSDKPPSGHLPEELYYSQEKFRKSYDHIRCPNCLIQELGRIKNG